MSLAQHDGSSRASALRLGSAGSGLRHVHRGLDDTGHGRREGIAAGVMSVSHVRTNRNCGR